MAIAGSPASAIPCSRRSASSAGKLWVSEVKKASAEVSTSEATMILLRPRVSDMVPAKSMVIARAQVVMESGRLPSAAGSPNSLEKTGRSGCTS